MSYLAKAYSFCHVLNNIKHFQILEYSILHIKYAGMFLVDSYINLE